MRMTLALMSCLFVLALLAAPASGATYYVCTEGNDANSGTSPKLAWKTITHAAKTAKAGDLVRIKGGDYGHENVVVANSGTAEAPIRFEGYDGIVKIEGPKAKSEGQGVLIEDKSHIVLSGITTLKYNIGILVKNSHHVTVQRCTAGITGWCGIVLTGSHHCLVSYCTAYNADMDNITVFGGHHNTIADCWSYCNPLLKPGTDYLYGGGNTTKALFIRCRGDGKLHAGHGICFTAAGNKSAPGCSDCRVVDCELYNCWELFGVRDRGHRITFENCYGEGKIVDTAFTKGQKWYEHSDNWYNQGFYSRNGAHDITVKNCRVRGVRYGLHADNLGGKYDKTWGVTKNITFINCIATECLHGIRLNAQNSKAVKCFTARNIYGVRLGKESGLSVKDSIIYQNKTAIRSDAATEVKGIITNCNLWDNQRKFLGKVILGADCISKDPQFAKKITDYGDWQLKETSLCKDMGPYADNPKASIGMR